MLASQGAPVWYPRPEMRTDQHAAGNTDWWRSRYALWYVLCPAASSADVSSTWACAMAQLQLVRGQMNTARGMPRPATICLHLFAEAWLL